MAQIINYQELWDGFKEYAMQAGHVAEEIEWFHANHPDLPLYTEVYKGNIFSILLLQKNNFTQFNEDEHKIF